MPAKIPISLYKIGSTGALTEVTPRAVTGDSLRTFFWTRPGSFCFRVNSAGNTISAFSIDSGTGALTLVGTPLSTFGFTPIRGAIAPSGKFLYVANSNSASISGSSSTARAASP